VISRTSDDRGEYRLFWLPAGAYLISAAPRVLARAPEGRGAGIAAQPVSPSQVASMKQQFVTTFYPGTADPKNATAVSVPRSGEVVAVDITLRRATPARISGQIQFARSGAARGAPTTTAEIMVLQRDSNAPEPDVVSEGRIVGTATLTGDNGTFLVTGILPGAYDLYARLPFPNTDGGAPTTYGRTSIDVQERDLTNVSIAVYGHARVNGTVRIDDRAPSAVPVRIALEPEGSAAKIPVYRNIAVRPVVAGGDGTFMVPAVLPGRYRLKIANELPPEVYVADVLQGGSSIFDQGFEFGAEAPPPIQVVLRSGAAALNGVVRDSADKPVAGATVVLVPLDRRQNRGLYATRVADASGQFSIRSLAPGVYKVFAWEQAIVAGSYYNATFLSRYEDRGQSVNLTQTATGTVTITAIPAGE
jgi:protocatechuate 3,4-dioxygenase beta subunit